VITVPRVVKSCRRKRRPHFARFRNEWQSRIGGRFSEPALATWRTESLTSHAAACQVVYSALGEHIGDVAALSVVIYRERKTYESKS
jgi:hypothetical protein